MADVALTAGGTEPTPLDYTIPGAQEIIVKACTASYDGSSAIVPYVPTLIIRAPNDAVLAACPVGATVAAGASADCSWFPRVTSSLPPTGVFYNVHNAGTWLHVDASGTDPATGAGIWMDAATVMQLLSPLVHIGATSFQVTSGNTITFTSVGASQWQSSGDLKLSGGSLVFSVNMTASGIAIGSSATLSKVGFFAKAPVNRQATPVTLADVIALLQAYGLCP